MATSTFRSRAREVARIQRLLSVLLAQSLGKALAVWIEALLAALLPRGFELRRGDVPIGPAFPADGSQVQAKLFDRGPSEEPVAIVDPVDHEAGLQHDHVRDHRIVEGIGVLGDVEIFLDDAPRIGEEGPVCTDAAAVFVGLGDVVGADPSRQ